MTPTEAIREEALILRSWGLAVFPLAKKRPRVYWKRYQRRLPSDKEVGRMFALSDVDGIGVIPGSGGYLCRDFDSADAYHQWATDHPSLARIAPTVSTRRGFHVWGKTTTPVWMRCGDGELIADRKHYTVLPPSRHHPSGVIYRWVNGPPLGPSEFPLLNPQLVGLHPTRKAPKGDTRHLLLSASSSAALRGGEGTLPAALRECVLRTMPDRAGQRNGRLLQLARALRDHVPDDAPPGLLYDAVLAWWGLALPVIGTKDFATTLADFRRAWSAVRVPMSVSRPLRALALGAATGGDTHARLFAACVALAAETGGEFHLSVRTAAAVVGVRKSHAARLLKSLVSGGDLRLVSAGQPSGRKRRASVYRIRGI